MHSAPVPILDWKRRRPTQRNHLQKKTRKCPTERRPKNLASGITRHRHDWSGKFDPDWCKSGRAGWVGVGLFCFHQLVGCWADAGLLLASAAAAAALVKVGETRAAALAVLLEPATGKVTGFFRPCSSQAQCSNVQVATFYI